jgi:orotate phosphoribosyltransferase
LQDSINITADPLDILHQLGGYYECPKDAQGNRLGPLVGYAGTYDGDKHYVGDVYANFAVVEERPDILDLFVEGIYTELSVLEMAYDGELRFDAVCGMPMGGLAIALAFARHRYSRYLFAEKQVLEAASEGRREKSRLVFKRHAPRKGDRIVIGEDVTNNFSTTEEAITLIEAHGAIVVGIISFLNRSLTVEDFYEHGDQKIPVISLVRKPIPEYRQDDPVVAGDIIRGNVIWKPKDHWPELMAAMAANQK